MDDFADRLADMSPERLRLLATTLKAALDDRARRDDEPIAITGMSCRFPRAPDIDAFWHLLDGGVDAITEVPPDRFDVRDYYDPDPDAVGKMYVRHGGFIDDVFEFEPGFFGISPREARSMDPQQRLLLEVAWEAFEDAGEATAALAGSQVGVFVGHSTNDYVRRSLQAEIDIYSGTGSATSIAAGRLSYVFGLTGPNLAIDTACSSSLVAVHLACRSLRARECDSALAAGVNLILAPEPTIYFCKMRALAADGRCKAFDALANGYVRGEGCGAIVLKRLSDARADGDRIHAVIRGSAINQDGRSTGLTVPNRFAQEALLRQALAVSGLAASDVDYVEAHGTGTPLGDPIEAQAIGAVHRGRSTPLLVGSVKTNVGHLEAAAGIAGVIKAVLAIQKGRIPPHLHLQRPSPYIPWDDLPIAIPTAPAAWPGGGGRPRIAGVSSFGFSGTNAHVVLEQAPPVQPRQVVVDRPLHVLCLSGRTPEALPAFARAMADRLGDAPPGSLADICYSVNAGRSHFAERLTLVAGDEAEAARALARCANGEPGSGVRTATTKAAAEKVVFLFTGQGSQYAQMGRELYDSLPVFRRALDECDALLRGDLEVPLLTVLHPPDGFDSPIDETAFSQPALFALEYSLATVWRAWGVEPAFCLGHSIGELVAACVAGVFPLADGLRLAAARGRLMQSLPKDGSMASVLADGPVVSRVLQSIGSTVSIAALNGPSSTVISGAQAAVGAALDELARHRIGSRPLAVSHAFHSSLMDPILDPLEDLAGTMAYQPPRIGLVSNVTGQVAAADDCTTAGYWRRHARQPVLFADAIRSLDERGYTVYLEIGPQPVLSALARGCVADRGQLWAPSLRKAGGDWRQMLQTLGDLYLRGVALDWRGFDASFDRRRVSVPTYPFQRSRYLLDADRPVTLAAPARSRVPAVEAPDRPADWLYDIQWTPGAMHESRDPVSGRWLLFVDRAGAGGALADRLEAAGSESVRVEAGGRFEALGGNRWRVRPDHPDDFVQLLAAADDGQPLAGVVHAWSLDIPDADRLDEPAVAAAAALGTASTFHLFQALARRRLAQPPRLWVVTAGVHAVRPGDSAAGVAQSPVWGFARSAAIELPNLRCTRVDLGSSSDSTTWADQAAASLFDLLRAREGEDQLALRDGQLYVPRLRRAAATEEPGPAIDGAGTYLISGGLGSLGLLVARWLVEAGARHVALVGRDEPNPAARHEVEALRHLGADILTLQVDIGDDSQVAELFARLAATLPAIKGIVHAAGVLDDGALEQQEWRRFEAVWRPKVSGAWNLHVHSRPLTLDFMVFFSSLTSLLGAPTQANYSAANAFMDALAHHRRARGLPAIAINWGPWQDVGMAARQQRAVIRTWELLGIGMLPGPDALQSLGRLLGSRAAQVGVIKADWSKLLTMFAPGLEPPLVRDLVAGQRRARPASAEWLAITARAGRTTTEDAARSVRVFVAAMVADVLGLPDGGGIDPERGFFDLGMDSMTAVEFTARLRASLGDAHLLPVSLLFNHPTVRSVADYLVAEALPSPGAVPASQPAPAARSTGGAIAIVGYACRFPGDPTGSAFWDLLRQGRDAVAAVPADRWDIDVYYDPDPQAPGRMCVREGGFLEAIDRFDAQFFGISAREAIKMDPQQRILLETTWHALEDAHQDADRLKGSSTGVFVGISGNDYIRTIGPEVDAEDVDAHLASGNLLSIAAGRLSHVLGLQGPCLAVDTACSSSLVAVHLACDSLRSGQSRLAVAGGVNIILAPEVTISLSRIGALAPDGRCKTFDAAANGYVRSEGCGMVVLKRLDDAEADGDRILAVIRASAINHDGRSSGLTVPNGSSQVALLREALAAAGVRPDEVQYVEAHGTGTTLGDPIEMQSIAAVYGERRPADQPVLVGSVKTNIGHLEAAAGVAGLIKVIESIRRAEVPPHLHFRQPSPYIDWPRLPVRIPIDAEAWPPTARRLAAVSSFGFSGTNAHCIVEEPPSSPARPVAEAAAVRPVHLLLLSAKTEPALIEQAGNVAAVLDGEADDARLADLFFSLNAGRAHFPCRSFIVSRTRADAVRQLRAVAQSVKAGAAARWSTAAGPPRIAFLFAGQGTQCVGMGRQLFETQPTFRRAVEAAMAAADGFLDRPLQSVLYPRDEAGSAIDDTAYAQPVLFALEYGLLKLWESWGIRPSVVVGHSVGECVAACAAGVFSMEAAVALTTERARLLCRLPHDQGMCAVAADVGVTRGLIGAYDGLVSVAADNSPKETVIEGSLDALAEVCRELERRGIRSTRLNIPHAFHGGATDDLAGELLEVARRFEYREPALPMVSTVTGAFVSDGEVSNPEYWARQLLLPVQFRAAMQALAATDCTAFVEIGPHRTLARLAEQTVGAADSTRSWLSSLRRGNDEWQEMLTAAGQLYRLGAAIDARGFDRDYDRRWLPVPRYPFQRQRYWPGASADRRPAVSTRPGQPAAPVAHDDTLLGRRLRSPGLQEIVFENRFSAGQPAFLADHKIFSMVVVPGASHLAMACAAASRIGVELGVELTEVTFPEGMILETGETRLIQLLLSREQDGARLFRVVSAPDDENPSWLTHSTGRMAAAGGEAGLPALDSLQDIRQRCTDHLTNTRMFYRLLEQHGIELGANFQWIDEIWRRPREGVARLRAAVPDDHIEQFHVHPGWIDACFQLVTVTLTQKELDFGTYLPISVGRFTLYSRPDSSPWIHVTLRPKEDDDLNWFESDISMMAADGRLIASIERFRVRRAPRESMSRFAQRKITDSLYTLQWLKAEAPAAAAAAPDGAWLILDRDAERSAVLSRSIEAAGGRCVLVVPGSTFEKREDGSYAVDPAAPDSVQALVADAAASLPGLRGVVHLWSAGGRAWQTADGAGQVMADQVYGCRSALNLVKALVAARLVRNPRLWLVTSAAQPVSDRQEPVDATHAPVWGFGRVVALEYPQLRCTRIDLDRSASPIDQAEALLAELKAESDEDQIAYRAADRYLARLSRYRVAATTSDDELSLPAVTPFRLVRSEHGSLNDMIAEITSRQSPGRGEVEIRVVAAGLNFRDVLQALGLYPGTATALGWEAAGVVSAVGPDVTGISRGDEVVALAPGSFARFVTTDARLVVARPAALGFATAASLPVVFLTAHYGLRELARLRPGDRLLVHAAAGGVGMAAIQIARRIGAEVFATAGSDEKRAYLRALGVTHVFDSRSLEFADAIRGATGGAGVDVVFNSLAGDFIPTSLALLAEGGRFVEIGKIGTWTPEQVAAARPDVQYFVFALDALVLEEPLEVRARLSSLMDEFASGALEALPHIVFPTHKAKVAFRHMAQARHIGKIVLEHPAAADRDAAVSLRDDASYLITGGRGGLGVGLAEWLVAQGARHVAVVGRRAPGQAAAEALAALEIGGARILSLQADVAVEEDVRRVVDRIGQEMPPLRGVFHAAGVLDDGILLHQNWDRFAKVMAPKVEGAIHLHNATLEAELDFFVMFSSSASLFGFPGQGNYAAANSFLDAFAHYRQAIGRPALSINWGPWDNVGMTVAVQRPWSGLGISTIKSDQGFDTLGMLLRDPSPQVAVVPIEWSQIAARFQSGSGAAPPLLSGLIREFSASLDPSPEWTALAARVAAAPPPERRELVVAALMEMGGAVLGSTAALDPKAPLNELGFDSLMAVELANRLGRSAGVPLSVTLLFDYPTFDALAGYLLVEVLRAAPAEPGLDGRRPQRVDLTPSARELVEAVAALSEEDVAMRRAPPG